MTIYKVEPDYYPNGINMYVPACAYVAAVRDAGATRISFGKPALADDDAILTAADALKGDVATTKVVNFTTDATWGRNITAKASAAVGAGTTCVITITGFDYLGQPMQENISIAHADAGNLKSGTKAFKRVTKVVSDGGGSADVTINIGFGDALGLPFKTIAVLSEEANGAGAANGTLVKAVVTDPQTITTGDPRGTYDPTTALNGATEITGTFLFDNSTNAAGNGGYFGIKHYSA